MRELHGYHGEHRRDQHSEHSRHPLDAAHARDAAQSRDGTADARPKNAYEALTPKAREALKLKMLTDPEARKAARLSQGKLVREAYNPRHAAEQPNPQGPKPDHVPPETPERQRRTADRETNSALAEVDERTARLPDQAAKKQKSERSWLPRADTFKMLGGNSLAIASIAVGTDLISDTWEKVGISVVAAIAGNVTWANRRWKEKHGNRSEGGAGDQDDARPRDTA